MAQYFTEGFDNVGTLWSNGWAQENRSSSLGTQPLWFQGDPSTFVALNGADTSYIAANYNSLGGTGTSISNWLFAPTSTFHNGEKFIFWTRTVDQPNFPDRLQVRMSLNDTSTYVGTTAGSVGDFSTLLLSVNPNLTRFDYPNVWTQYTLIISGLSGPTVGRIAFRYFVGGGGPSGSNSEYIGIDSVSYFLPPPGDLQMLSVRPVEYTRIPARQPFSRPLLGIIDNYGSSPVIGTSMQVNVFQGATLVSTLNSPPADTLFPGERDTFVLPVPSPLAVGNYTLQYIAQHPGSDGDPANDTLYDHFEVTELLYARDNGDLVGDIGIGTLTGGLVGQSFHFIEPDKLDSVWVHMARGYAGRPLAALVWNMAGGIPNQIIGATDTLVYTTDSAATYVLPLHGGSLALVPGDYAITFIEFDSTLHIGLASAVFTDSTTWLSWPSLPSGTWATVEFFGLERYIHAQMIRLVLDPCTLQLSTVIQPISVPGGQDGVAAVVATGGTPPFTYNWSNGGTSPILQGLPEGPLTVTVTDSLGCSASDTLNVIVGTSASVKGQFICTLSPNPNPGRFQLQVQTPQPGSLEITVTDLSGRLLWHALWDPAALHQIEVDLPEGSRGMYLVQVISSRGGRKVFRVLVD
jgi:hypothetical protein